MYVCILKAAGDEKCDCTTMGVCKATGDPHVTTFDKRKIDFIAAPGHWWMVHSPDKHVSIQALYRAGYGKHDATTMHAVAVSMTTCSAASTG